MLVGHDQTARGPLVLTAHELLRGTLDTVKQRNRIVTHRAEMEFIVSKSKQSRKDRELRKLTKVVGILWHALRKRSDARTTEKRQTTSRRWVHLEINADQRPLRNDFLLRFCC